VLAGLPLEPVVLGEVARGRGLDVRSELAFDTFFLGGSPLPPALRRRLERTWNVRVVEVYGSTETMLLGSSCAKETLHVETEVVYCEGLDAAGDPVPAGGEGRPGGPPARVQGRPPVRVGTRAP